MISSEQKWSFSFCSALCFAHYGLRSSLSSSQLAAAHSDCCMLVFCKHTIVLLTGKLVMKLLHLVERCRTPAHKVQEVQSGKPKQQETERKWKLHVLRRHFFSMVTDMIRDLTAHTIRLIENHWRMAVAHESQLIREWVWGLIRLTSLMTLTQKFHSVPHATMSGHGHRGRAPTSAANHKDVCGKSQRDRHPRCQPRASPTALTNW